MQPDLAFWMLLTMIIPGNLDILDLLGMKNGHFGVSGNPKDCNHASDLQSVNLSILKKLHNNNNQPADLTIPTLII